MKEEGYSDNLLSRYLVADEDIKDGKCKTQEWANAVIYMLYENYKSNAVPIVREIDLDDETLQSAILKKYIITNNNDDILAVVDVCNDLLEFDKGKVILELSSMNVFRKRYEKSAIPSLKRKWCFFGIKRIPKETDEEFKEEQE
jgi:hypothetical protein